MRTFSVCHPDTILKCSPKGEGVNHIPQRDIKRQVFDIPIPKVEVTEHRAEVKWCLACQGQVMAKFPIGVHAPVQYGEVIKSCGLYLQHEHLIPEERVQSILSDLFGVSLATATINGFSEKLYGQLAEFESGVLSKVQEAKVKHLDETGFRIAARTNWLHVASTPKLTYYHVSPKRKSLLEGLKNIVVHDHWKSYYQLPNVLHALCNQHHLRELKSLIEYDKEVWAKKLYRFLCRALRYRHAFEDRPIPDKKLERWIGWYYQIIDEGMDYHESLPVFSTQKGRGRRARRTGHNLLLRLKHYSSDVLRFLFDPEIPFTNNQAERDIRMMKCKQKISGGFRSRHGADIFIRIRGFISTARKQGWNVFESILQAVKANVPRPVLS